MRGRRSGTSRCVKTSRISSSGRVERLVSMNIFMVGG